MIVADAYPNFSICGIPYYVSGEVSEWRSLAHRSIADLEATGMTLRLDTVAQRIDPDRHRVVVGARGGVEEALDYDALVVATGALPVRPPIDGLDRLGPADGVHVLHSMGDTFALMRTLEARSPRRAAIVGAGYIGLEPAEALVARGLSVTQVEQLPEVLATVDPELGALVHAELERHGVEVRCSTRVTAVVKTAAESLELRARRPDDQPLAFAADVVLVVVGVRPDGELASAAGCELGPRGAIAVDRHMRTSVADAAGFDPVTVPATADDHKAYYPGSHPIAMRFTGDRRDGRLLGAQVVGRRSSEIAKRIDVPATAIFNGMTVDAISDLDQSYAPPLGSPWDALQTGAQAWVREARAAARSRGATSA